MADLILVRSMRVYILFVLLGTGAFSSNASAQPSPRVTYGAVAPAPEYAPKPAAEPGLHGSGVFIIRVHITSGQVTDVGVALSTGNHWLDRSAVAALREWRFKPGAAPYHKASTTVTPQQTKDETFIKVPVTF